MRSVGPVQRDIVRHIKGCGEAGAFIGAGTRSPELRGYNLEQVERSLDRLVRRGIVVKVGILHKMK